MIPKRKRESPFKIFLSECQYTSVADYKHEKILLSYYLWKCLPIKEKEEYKKRYLYRIKNVVVPDVNDYRLNDFKKDVIAKKNNNGTAFIKRLDDESENKNIKLVDLLGFQIVDFLSADSNYGRKRSLFLYAIDEMLEKNYKKEELMSQANLRGFDYIKLAVNIYNDWQRLSYSDKTQYLCLTLNSKYKNLKRGKGTVKEKKKCLKFSRDK